MLYLIAFLFIWPFHAKPVETPVLHKNGLSFCSSGYHLWRLGRSRSFGPPASEWIRLNESSVPDYEDRHSSLHCRRQDLKVARR
ncbi:hypothetical protein ACFPT7_02225 [Acidicapsa dinghuensis]|uniref:Secreted protein n=1 Tax=Acidicapsa dinghuensis TaxID=2218256 RepID=A0ABW1ECW6_9BACT|nr:hypothetical protein [Acidicapsa dinghuensis]